MSDAEYIACRLRDIICLAENTRPVNDDDWKGYTLSVLRHIARQAIDAQEVLSGLALNAEDGETR